MNKHYFSLMLFCILQINSFTTRAQLYWSESFGSYTNGQNIDALNGWNYQNPTNTGYKAAITDTPLTYGDLVLDNTYFTGGGSYISIGVAIPITGALKDAYAADGNTAAAGYKSGGKNEFWYSMLIRSDLGKNGTFGFHDKWPWYLDAAKLQVSRDNTGLWSIVVDGTQHSSGVTVEKGVTALLVCKINFAADGTTLTLYVNPVLGTTPTTGVTAKSAVVQNISAIGFGLNNDPGNYSIDELRIGATFADVTPIVDKVAPSIPTGLSATGILQSSFTLNWTTSTDNVGVDSYEVFKDGVSVGTTATTSLNITGLTASTTYSLTVKAKDSTGNASLASSPLSVKTSDSDILAPSVPTGLTALTITQLGFSFNWVASTDNVGVASYEVYKNDVSVGTSITNHMNVTGLSPSTTYSFSVKAKDAVGNTSLASTALSVTTKDLDTQAPIAPTALVPSAVTSSGFTLNWTASTDNVGVTSYMILQDGVFLKSTNVTTATIIGLSSSSTYAITVKATDAAGNISVASDPLSVTTLVFVPSPTSYIEDFNDNKLTDWYGAGISEQNKMLKIIPAKGNVWEGFGFSFSKISIKATPYVSLKIKSNFAFNITMAVGKKGGKIDNYPLRPMTVGIIGAQGIEPSSDFQEYSFDFTGLAATVLDSISNIHFVLNPLTTQFGTSPNKEIYFDDIKIGDVAAHTPAISNIQDQTFTVKASGAISRTIKFSNVNDGSTGTNPITISAISSNTAVIPNPQVTYTSPGTVGSIILSPNVLATGEAIISVIVSAANTTNKVMTFKLSVVPNAAPTMSALPNMIVKKGTLVTVALDKIYNGNPESIQKINIKGTSSNVSVIPTITIKHDSTDFAGSLSFTPSLSAATGSIATVTVRLKDDGGIVSNGIDSARYSFNVSVFDELNHQPTFDSIPPKSAKAIAGTYRLDLTGLSDGDNKLQNLSYQITASTDSVLTNMSVGNMVNGIAPFNYTLTGKTGLTTVTIKVTDDGGNASNNGNLFITHSFVISSVPAPVTGLTANYIPFIGNVSAAGVSSDQANKVIEILPDGTVHLKGTVLAQSWPSSYFSLGVLTDGKELDMSAKKYVSFKVKCASTTTIELPTKKLDATTIVFRLVDNIGPGQPGSGYEISKISLSIPNDDAWHDMYLDFNGLFFKDKKGGQTDSTRITKLMLDINNTWFQQISGDYYFKDLKLGDQAERPQAIPHPTINPIPNQVVYKGHLPKPILLSGISNGSGKLTADLTTGTNNPKLISGINIGDIINGTALLKYTINASVADSAVVTVIANNTSVLNAVPDTVSFKVYLNDTATVANNTINTININFSKTYQTLAGIGTMLNNSNDPIQIQEIKDLNITVMRLTQSAEFEPANDNSDPNVIDYSKFNYNALPTDLIRQVNEQTNCHKFFYSPWSPPSWMKQNKASFPDPSTLWATNNILSPDMYDEFAEYLVAICKTIKEKSGVELYAISMQNEPTFNEPYGSCKYTGAQFRDLLKVVGPRFKAENINTRIILSEDVASNNWVQDNVKPTIDDAIAKQYLGIVACHNYDPDGIRAGGAGTAGWASLLAFKNTSNAEGLWMTETSGFGNVWEGYWGLDYLNGGKVFFPGPLDFAGSIYTALKAGNISAWIDFDGTKFKNTNDLEGSVFKNYSAFINPGAVMVDAISNNKNILSLAFKNTDNSVTSILLNTSEKPLKVTLKGTGVPKVYRAFTTQNFAAFTEGATVTNGAIVLPPRSITTLTHSLANLAPTVDQTSNLFIDLAEGDKSITLSGIGYGADPGVQLVTSVSATSGNTDVAKASVVYTTNSSSAMLKITPVTYGTTLVSVKVKDNGGVAGGGIDSTVIKFYITILNSINHVPTINTLEPITMLEDADSLRVNLTGISDGDSGTQLLKVVVSSSKDELIRPRISYVQGANSAYLIFKPTPNLSGSSILSVLITDNGGNENNNGNMAAKIDIPVTVLPVNDAPTITAVLTSATIKIGALKRFPITIGDGESDAIQTLSYELVNATPDLVDTRIIDNLNNGLILNVTGKAAGDVILKFVLKDNGGIQNGGIDTSILIFNIKVESLVGVNEIDLNNISLYPNPAHDYVYLKLNNYRADNVVITDAAGQIVLQQNVLPDNNECKLSIGNLPVGLYFIQVNSGTKSQILKFIHH